MAERTVLQGRYRVANEASLRTRMESLKGDPRFQFYQAMFATDRYETYLAAVGRTKVEVKGFKMGPISGRMEILYARRQGWIEDAGPSPSVKSRGPLAQITADAVEKAVLEYDDIKRDQFLEKYGFGKAKEYYLVFKGKRYDSKAIVGAAYQHVSPDGKPLRNFSGGERTVGRLLKKLGFEVEKISSGFPQPNFERGRIYNRRNDIHAIFGGQQQGGIATPQGPYIFLFTGQQGTNYGYHDGARTDDGVFEYTGEGQTGDMQFIKGNKAIRDHAADGKDLLLFQTLKAKGTCRYLGSFVCADWTFRNGKDKTGANRKTIVFDLVPAENLDAANHDMHDPPDPRISFEELRKRAYAAAASPTGKGQSKRNVYARSRDVRNWVLARAKGICEACKNPAPFERADGTPYLESHHTRRSSDGGPDHPRWVGAICPTCHRRIHHSIDGPKLNEVLQAHLLTVERGNS